MTPAWLGAAEPPAPSEPPGVCDPTAKPGARAFRDWVLRRFGGADLGIVRACDIGKPSHHHEGRAWDWAALASSPSDRARVDALLSFLHANGDEAMRRAGIRFFLWDAQKYTAGEGLTPHTGNPHRDHVHFSLSRAGASGLTSFYRWLDAGEPLMLDAPPAAPASEGGAGAGLLVLGALGLAALARR